MAYEKLIITCALTGGDTVPSQNASLPITPTEILKSAAGVGTVGASIVHVHTRDPEDGRPVSDLALFTEIVEGIREQTPLLVNITTGGAAGMTLEERLRPLTVLRPDLATLNCGSMNFATYPVVRRLTELRHSWEREYLEFTKDFVFRNTFADIERVAETIYGSGAKPELEAYDVGHLYNARFLLDEGVLRPPLHVQFVLGVLGGMGSTTFDLITMKQAADRLLGQDQYTWSVAGVGYPGEFYLGAVAMTIGGHVRVGLEDNVRSERRRLATNEELVEKAVQLASLLDREVCSPADARELLALPGKG